MKTSGIQKENIRIVRDKEATKLGILNAIKQQLIDKAKPGDVCVFHFSGHGEQVFDDNGDEADGYDEALVTYDAPMEYQPGVEKHLRDDEFGLKLEEIRTKLGADGNLLVIIDACHSGTSTRSGLGNYRGTTKIPTQRLCSQSECENCKRSNLQPKRIKTGTGSDECFLCISSI
ncbi:MAG: caspase family protein [Chitinophagaceae bacterium]|nr:caspase family protein [Chitinophagaceae bacterium]